MAITLGSISVADNGVVTKAGEIGVLFDLLYANAITNATAAGATPPADALVAGSTLLKSGVAQLATTMATYCHGLLTARAQVKVSTTDSGIQRMPASTAEDTACKAPATDKFLSIV